MMQYLLKNSYLVVSGVYQNKQYLTTIIGQDLDIMMILWAYWELINDVIVVAW